MTNDEKAMEAACKVAIDYAANKPPGFIGNLPQSMGAVIAAYKQAQADAPAHDVILDEYGLDATAVYAAWKRWLQCTDEQTMDRDAALKYALLAYENAKSPAVAASPQAPADSASAPEWDRPLTPEEQAMIDAAWEKHKAAAPRAEDSASAEVEAMNKRLLTVSMALARSNLPLADIEVGVRYINDAAETIKRLQAQLASAVAAMQDACAKVADAEVQAARAHPLGRGIVIANRIATNIRALCPADTLKRLDAERAVIRSAVAMVEGGCGTLSLHKAVNDLKRLTPASADGEKEEGK